MSQETLVCVLDVGPSMQTGDDKAPTRLESAKKALELLLQQKVRRAQAQ